MKITSRLLLSGALALGALGTNRGLMLDTATADAAPSVSPFAGTYSDAPGAPTATSISISKSGVVRGSYSYDYWFRGAPYPAHYSGEGSGSVTDAGILSLDWVRTVRYYVSKHTTTTTQSQTHVDATVALDVAGDIVGTDSSGATFKWIRR